MNILNLNILRAAVGISPSVYVVANVDSKNGSCSVLPTQAAKAWQLLAPRPPLNCGVAAIAGQRMPADKGGPNPGAAGFPIHPRNKIILRMNRSRIYRQWHEGFSMTDVDMLISLTFTRLGTYSNSKTT